MPLTRRALVARSFVLIALAAALPLAGVAMVALAFSGVPSGALQRLLFALSAVLWIPVLISWWFPASGLVAFLLLASIPVAHCALDTGDVATCLGSGIFMVISGVCLGLSLIVTVRDRREQPIPDR